MNLEKQSYALGVYCYPKTAPSPKQYEGIYNCFIDLLKEVGVKPNYIGVDGGGFSEELVDLDSSGYLNKLKKNGFSNIEGFTLVANPENSEKPAFDHYAYLDVGYSDIDEELVVCLVIDKAFVNSLVKFERSIATLAKIISVDYALGFVADSELEPSLHILGADNGKLDVAEKASLQRWYVSDSEDRANKVRDIYLFNVLNKNQLSQEVDSGTLRDYLESRFDRDNFYELAGTELFVCNVPEGVDSEVREQVSTALI